MKVENEDKMKFLVGKDINSMWITVEKIASAEIIYFRS